MGIFYNKTLLCGCQIVAAKSREENNCIFIINHTYKWICSKCINLSDKIIDNRLENIKKNDNKIYVSFINGWYRSLSSPTDYYVPCNENRI